MIVDEFKPIGVYSGDLNDSGVDGSSAVSRLGKDAPRNKSTSLRASFS